MHYEIFTEDDSALDTCETLKEAIAYCEDGINAYQKECKLPQTEPVWVQEKDGSYVAWAIAKEHERCTKLAMVSMGFRFVEENEKEE